jgi:hypothetical protein
MTGFLHIMVPHDEFALEQGKGSLPATGFWHRCGPTPLLHGLRRKGFYQPRSDRAWSANANCLDDPIKWRNRTI